MLFILLGVQRMSFSWIKDRNASRSATYSPASFSALAVGLFLLSVNVPFDKLSLSLTIFLVICRASSQHSPALKNLLLKWFCIGVPYLHLALKHFAGVVYACVYLNSVLWLTIHLCLLCSLPFIDTRSIAGVDSCILLMGWIIMCEQCVVFCYDIVRPGYS